MKSIRSIHLAFALSALAALPALASAQTGSTTDEGRGQHGAQGAGQQGAGQQGAQGTGQQGAQGTGQQGAGQQGAQGTRQQGAQGGGEQQRAQQQKSQRKETSIQEQVSFPVEGGCKYSASIHGKLQHAGGGQQPSKGQQGGAQRAPGQHGQQEGSQAPAGGAQAGGPQGGAAQAQAGAQERLTPDLTVVATMNCPNAAEVRISETLKTTTPVTRTQLEEMIARRASIATEKDGRRCIYVPDFQLSENKLSSRGVTQLCRLGEGQRQGMR